MKWKTLLSYVTGSVDQELLLRSEYLVAENRVLRNQVQGRLRLNDSERKSLAEIGIRLGRKALAEVATVVKPETILAWRRRLVPVELIAEDPVLGNKVFVAQEQLLIDRACHVAQQLLPFHP